jgi:hypothetical protein
LEPWLTKLTKIGPASTRGERIIIEFEQVDQNLTSWCQRDKIEIVVDQVD